MPFLPNPYFQVIDANGNPYSGAKLYVYDEDTTDLRANYSDPELTVQHANPQIADSAGRFNPIYIASSGTGVKFRVDSSVDVLIDEIDNVEVPNSDAPFYAQTPAESSASITPTDFTKEPGDMQRYGIVANSSGAATANTTAIKSLLDPTTTGPKGNFWFDNTTGADVYHFNDRVPIRDDVHIDLRGCTLQFTKTGDATDSDTGCLRFVRKSSLRNGKIDVDYTYTAGTNCFNAITLAGRDADNDFADFFDDLASEPYGDIVIENVKVNHNGGINCSALLAYSGVRNVTIRNFSVEGNGTLKYGIVYEFGFATNEASNADRQSSHAYNWQVENMAVENMDTTTSGAAIRWGGGYNIEVNGLYVRKCYNGIICTPGEALFYNPWDPENEAENRTLTFRNLVMSELESIGVTVAGAQANTGYLSGVSISDQDLVDLYDMVVDGFDILGGTGGTTLSVGIDSSCGRTVIRNGTIKAASNGIRFNDEGVLFDIDNVRVLDCTSTAGRLSFAGGIFSTERKKIGTIRNCFFGGNEGIAITVDHAEMVRISNCRFGYETAFNGVSETTQDSAIQVGADAYVIADSNYVAAVADAGNAYTGISGGIGVIQNPLGDHQASTQWITEDQYNSVTTVGDANRTLTPRVDNKFVHFSAALTVNRTVTLSTTDAIDGDEFIITRSGLGSFTLDIGGLKTIASATAGTAHVKYDGAAWYLVSYTDN